MTLLSPIWLLLLLPLFIAVRLWPPPSRLLLALRAVTVVLAVLAMCGLSILRKQRAGTLVVIADRSRSMPTDSLSKQKEVIDLLQSKMSPLDRLAVVSFGRQPSIERIPQAGKFSGFVNRVDADGSNLNDAIKLALSLIPDGHPGKILLLSDGRWTGKPPNPSAARAAARNIAIDVQTIQRPSTQDVAITRIQAPNAVSPKEAFLLTAWVQSPISQEVELTLLRNGKVLLKGKRKLKTGANRLLFRDKAQQSGTYRYVLRVKGKLQDPVPENNQARFLIGVKGTRPILHVTQNPNSGLAQLLQRAGLAIHVKKPEACDWSLAGLSQYAALLLEDVPAGKLGHRAMQTIAAWVKETGAGLLMTGGKNSYGPGGYFRSPLEKILPVSMELRREHRKLSLAIVVALDRSGSMSAPVGGGQTKMDLANQGTAQTLDLLGSFDEIGVLAVDSAPHVIVPLSPIRDKAGARQHILSIASMGGGIFVYEALKKAHSMLQKARALTRHIILFADAADAEQPGKYKALLKKCQEQKITVSVIGLGKPTDSDAAFLRDVAKRGKGRIFFTERPEELPRLFAQDTFVVARSSFIEDKTPFRFLPSMRTVTQRTFSAPPPAGGYNLCYIRPGAQLLAVTKDEYKAPIIASWQVGLGRVIAYTPEADGKYGPPLAQWKQIGDLLSSLVRYTAGAQQGLKHNMLLTQSLKRGQQIVELHLDPERKKPPFSSLPKVNLLRAASGQKPSASRVAMRWLAPDRLQLSVPLSGSQTSLATVLVPGHKPISLSPVQLPYSPEYQPSSSKGGKRTMRTIARTTKGSERIDVSGLWKDIPRQARTFLLAPWLLILAVLLFLLEILERRSGMLSKFQKPTLAPSDATASKAASPKTPRLTIPTQSKDPQTPKTPEPAPQMLSALKQASHRAKQRTRDD